MNRDTPHGPRRNPRDRRYALLHVAQSLYHDHVPAQSVGLATAWIDRQRLSEGGDRGATARLERLPVTDYRFFSMAELAETVRSANSPT